ncbi:MAG: hypothetical protein JG776_447 [Caloramator sp.]|uniref:hypothetical protein n=1 Tax=Caloramator sp. TaxID=1871330 RepID=UPI001D4AB143|nr:hypothetical protein [Caloramator sp.]MBZ4662765.1 hypothetical protein [Caloramator sp.]
MIQKQEQIDYMKDLTKFAWLGQVINAMFGGKNDLYKEVTKAYDKLVTSFIETESTQNTVIEEWRNIAQQRGLKYTSNEEVKR